MKRVVVLTVPSQHSLEAYPRGYPKGKLVDSTRIEVWEYAGESAVGILLRLVSYDCKCNRWLGQVDMVPGMGKRLVLDCSAVSASWWWSFL